MKKYTLLLSLIVLTGCTQTVQITPFPTGGSKADGTVTMTYNYGHLEIPEVDWEEADKTATAKCKAWGYNKAESFGGKLTKCTAYNGYGCVRTQVDVTYQCLDK